MGSSGFIPELLVPGLIAVVAGLVAVVEFTKIEISDLGNFETAIALPVVLAMAYLLGLAMRHLPAHRYENLVFGIRAADSYRNRLVAHWPNYTEYLVVEWSEPDDNIPEGMDPLDLTSDHARALVNRMRVHQLSVHQSALAEHVNYQWDLARMSKNSLPSLGLLIFVCVAGAVVNVTRSSNDLVALYCVVATFSALLSWGLSRAYLRRVEYLLDTLIRASQAEKRSR